MNVKPAAAKIEPRMARAVEKALSKAGSVPGLGAISSALANGDVRAARAALDEWSTVATLTPAAMIIKDTFIDGGKLAAKYGTR